MYCHKGVTDLSHLTLVNQCLRKASYLVIGEGSPWPPLQEPSPCSSLLWHSKASTIPATALLGSPLPVSCGLVIVPFWKSQLGYHLSKSFRVFTFGNEEFLGKEKVVGYLMIVNFEELMTRGGAVAPF